MTWELGKIWAERPLHEFALPASEWARAPRIRGEEVTLELKICQELYSRLLFPLVTGPRRVEQAYSRAPGRRWLRMKGD